MRSDVYWRGEKANQYNLAAMFYVTSFGYIVNQTQPFVKIIS